MIPREQLERWRALADAATPGPWYAPEDGEHIIDGSGDYLMTDNNCLAPERADFQFTAAAREAVPALIAEVEAQAKEIERLRAALEKAKRVLESYHDDRPESFGASCFEALWAVEAALKEKS